MLEAINAMSLSQQLFLGCAVFGSILFILRMAMMFSGMISDSGDADGIDTDGDSEIDIDHDGIPDLDVHDSDVHGFHDIHDVHSVDDSDTGATNSDISFHYLSVQGLTAFFMMFGWVGFAMLSTDSALSAVFVFIVSLAAGFFALFLLAKSFKYLSKLQSVGNERISTALGKAATVYLRIPENGTGQIQVEIDGRLRTHDAVSSSNKQINTGDAVTVVWIRDDGILVVEKDE